MPQDPFPLPPGDADEPDGSALPAAEGTGPEDISEGLEQGLYVTLPAEHLTLAGFCQGGASDTMAPGALLATVVEAVLPRAIWATVRRQDCGCSSSAWGVC